MQIGQLTVPDGLKAQGSMSRSNARCNSQSAAQPINGALVQVPPRVQKKGKKTAAEGAST